MHDCVGIHDNAEGEEINKEHKCKTIKYFLLFFNLPAAYKTPCASVEQGNVSEQLI